MTLKEILEYNKRCAEFLGWKPNGHHYIFDEGIFTFSESNIFVDDLKFHSSWEWIMEVVDAIEKLEFFVHTLGSGCFVTTTNPSIMELNKWGDTIVTSTDLFNYADNIPTKLEAVVSTINQFLIWYNGNNK